MQHTQSLFFFFWPHRTVCGISVPQPGTEPRPPAVKAPSPTHWTTRESPTQCFFTHTQHLQSLVFLWTLEDPKNKNTLQHNLPSWEINTGTAPASHFLPPHPSISYPAVSFSFLVQDPILGRHFAFSCRGSPFSSNCNIFSFSIFHVFLWQLFFCLFSKECRSFIFIGYPQLEADCCFLSMRLRPCLLDRNRTERRFST